jgi:plasmid stabilization system protein ParE
MVLNNNESARKPARPTLRCRRMLREAMAYIANNSLQQAQIMEEQFYKIINLIELMPGIGTIYQNGIRKILLGKFRYNIYYREKKNIIEILGIWHTSRGTAFSEPKIYRKASFSPGRRKLNAPKR